jgi:hypothetical protein
MADLVLDWTDLAATTPRVSGNLGEDGSATYDAGGVAVDIVFDSQSDASTAYFADFEGYVAPGEDFDPNSHLKLFAAGNSTGTPSAAPTSTTSFTFRSTDEALYTDSVQNVSFRLNDVDTGPNQDLGGSEGDGFGDIITITAYDAEGNPATVSIDSSGAATVSGNSAIGEVTTNFDNIDGSLRVDITGPITRMDIVQDNTGTAQQAVLVSDINFSTVDVVANEDPDAVDDTETTDFETPVTIDVLTNDSDPDGDPLTITEVTDGANGTAVIDGGTVIYTPNAGFEGTDTFTYTITDGNGNFDTASVDVTVNEDVPPPPPSGNEDPDAVDDTAETDINTPVVIPVLDNDTDPDGDPLTVTEATSPDGTVDINTDGTVTFTPTTDFTGPAEISYTVDDGNGGTDTATVTVTVSDPDDQGRIDADVFPVADADQPLDPLNGADQDPDPFDDLDDVQGTGAAETISTGDDADTIRGDGGDDLIRPGIDDDDVRGGGGNDTIIDVQGSDTIRGGDGDDSIIAGVDTFSDYEGDDPNLPLTIGSTTFTSDPNPEDGRDFVEGNAGNDTIFTGDDRDTIDGGGDDDYIDAGIDDDIVMGGQGDDEIYGRHGSDTLDGGQGNDTLDGSAPAALEITDDTDPQPENDRDLLQGFQGDDLLIGGDDDDTLEGGSGNDTLDGGIDDDLLGGGGDDDSLMGGQGDDTLNGDAGTDTLEGGEGNDILNGGAGLDSIDGGADRDTIVVDSASDASQPDGMGGFLGDTVQGGNAGDDFDTLDLSGVGRQGVDWRIVNERPDDDGARESNGIDGTVEFLSGDTVTGSFDFFNIEEIVPCFTPGTKVATPRGERLVEDLREGDKIITRDNGIQEIRWVGRKDLTGFELARKPHMKPVLIRAGSLGANLPEHDMLVSPNHRMLVANDKTALYFEENEVLAAAKHLTGLAGVDEVTSLGVSYIHFMFDRHEVVLANGAWTESFQPGDYSLNGIGNAQRNEILELFPELAEAQGLKSYASARRSLKKHEAQLLAK